MAKTRAVVLPCTIDGCDKLGNAGRGWCWTHYSRWRAHGDPNILGPRGARGTVIADPIERFWSKVDKTDTCWLWRGNRRKRGGYGSLGWQGRTVAAHRLAYEMLVGPIPDGLVLDHTCRETSCVNPEHLEPVTVEENSSRARKRPPATMCGQGHPLTGDNVVSRKDGSRYCRSCFNDSQRTRRAGYRAERRILTALAALPVDYQSGDPLVDEVLDAINDYFDARFANSEWGKVFSPTT